MPRPSLRALALLAAVSTCLLAAVPSQAGQFVLTGPGSFARGAGFHGGPRRLLLPTPPRFVGARVISRHDASDRDRSRHARNTFDVHGGHAHGNSDYRHGLDYDAALARLYGLQDGPAIYQGPAIITLGAGAAIATNDPPVIAAPAEAEAANHGVRVVYLTDPPAQYQLPAGAEPRLHRRHHWRPGVQDMTPEPGR